MARKEFDIIDIKNADFTAWKTADLDRDGEAVIVDGSPKLRQGTTLDMMRTIIWNIPKSIQNKNDSLHVPRIMNSIIQAEETNDGNEFPARLSLRETDADFIQRVLNRDIPAKSEGVEPKPTPLTYGQVLFGLNLDYFKWQITDVDNKRDDYFADDSEEDVA